VSWSSRGPSTLRPTRKLCPLKNKHQSSSTECRWSGRCVARSVSAAVSFDEFDGAPEEIEFHQRCSPPAKPLLHWGCGATQAVGGCRPQACYPTSGAFRSIQLIWTRKAIRAINIAGRPAGLRQQVEVRAGRRQQSIVCHQSHMPNLSYFHTVVGVQRRQIGDKRTSLGVELVLAERLSRAVFFHGSNSVMEMQATAKNKETRSSKALTTRRLYKSQVAAKFESNAIFRSTPKYPARITIALEIPASVVCVNGRTWHQRNGSSSLDSKTLPVRSCPNDASKAM